MKTSKEKIKDNIKIHIIKSVMIFVTRPKTRTRSRSPAVIKPPPVE
jgi:hypothetical protein